MTQLEILIIILIVMVVSGWLVVLRKLLYIEDTIAKLNNMTNDNIFEASKLTIDGLEMLDKNLEADYDALRQILLYEMKMAQEEREEIIKRLENETRRQN